MDIFSSFNLQENINDTVFLNEWSRNYLKVDNVYVFIFDC